MNANQIKGTSGNAIQIQFGGALLSKAPYAAWKKR